MWRIFQLNKHLTKPGHVWSKFGSGNRESLSKHAKVLQSQGKLVSASPTTHVQTSPPSDSDSESEADGGEVGRETRRRLVEWWSKEYCASRMRLAVVGKGELYWSHTSRLHSQHTLTESLDELSDLVVRLFSAVPNRGRDALPMINDHPFGPEQKGVRIYIGRNIVMKADSLWVDTCLCANCYVFPCTWDLIPFGVPGPFLEAQTRHFHIPFCGSRRAWVSTLVSEEQALGYDSKLWSSEPCQRFRHVQDYGPFNSRRLW